MFIRGKQSDEFLKLSCVRKVSPVGYLRTDRHEWVAQMPNSFGLPAGTSCPGKTEFCVSCYAKASERQTGVAQLVQNNMRLLLEAKTVDGMEDLLARMMQMYVAQAVLHRLRPEEMMFRIHWDGDFFSVDYAEAWARVMHRFPEVQFWTYTRSFVEPVNVVPMLIEVPNLKLYLSADAWNIGEARRIADADDRVLLALCAVDYSTARNLATDRPTMICPENAGRIPLMSDGVGACVKCSICPEGKRDILFSTSHREDVDVIVPRDQLPMSMKVGTCQRPGCEEDVMMRPGPGRKPKYCSTACRWQMARKPLVRS